MAPWCGSVPWRRPLGAAPEPRESPIDSPCPNRYQNRNVRSLGLGLRHVAQWLERRLDTAEVGGSSPPVPTRSCHRGVQRPANAQHARPHAPLPPMSDVRVRLPDGRSVEVPAGTRVLDVAAGIGKGLARAALAGRVDGRLADLRAPLRASDDDALLMEVIDEAIGRKPKGHDFNVRRIERYLVQASSSCRTAPCRLPPCPGSAFRSPRITNSACGSSPPRAPWSSRTYRARSPPPQPQDRLRRSGSAPRSRASHHLARRTRDRRW